MYTLVHSRCPRRFITRSILLHYPGKSPRRLPQMLKQAKVSRRQHGTPKDNQEKHKTTHKEKRKVSTKNKTSRHRRYTNNQRTKHADKRKRIPVIKPNKIETTETHATEIKTTYQVAPESRISP